VHAIDDDPHFLEIVTCVLHSADINVQQYPCAERFLATQESHDADCVILDLRMPNMGGMDLLETMRSPHVSTPVLMLSAYHDTPDVVAAIKTGAVDYLLKPVDERELLTKVADALYKNWADKRRGAEVDRCLRSLSERECQVMELFVAAKTTRQVARELEISPKTVEKHRINIFTKMNVDSVPLLIRLLFDHKP
jgi:FixJ family two-component response regulator